MYKVLIVEDDPMVAMINEQYVCKNKDFSVIKSCRNGQEALDFLESEEGHAADLVIMDVFMPIMNGIETLKMIRRKKIDTEVIMVTAANDTATLEETMHLGVIDFLIKPFAFERFQVALEKFAIKSESLHKNAGSVIDQSYVDSLIASPSASAKKEKELPKGIQEKTLSLLIDYMNNTENWIPGDKIAEDVGLSAVTIRHYMNYLMDIKKVIGDINYSTGGRPSMLYRKS